MAESVDIKDRAFEWYLANPQSTLVNVAEEFEIPYETVRDWAKSEGWIAKRTIKHSGNQDDIILAQAEGIRAALYEGIMSGDARDLPDLVKAWNSTLDVQPPKEQVETIDRDSLL